MIRVYCIPILLSFCYSTLCAQLSAPRAEAVFGGRIQAITGVSIGKDTSRIYVTTESANTAFFMDVYHRVLGTPPVYDSFQVVPALDAAGGLGGNVREIAAHAGSGHLYLIHQGDLYHTDPLSRRLTKIDSMGIQALFIDHDFLFYTKGTELRFGQLDLTGRFTAATASPLMLPPGMSQVHMATHPTNQALYLFEEGNTPLLYKTTDPFYGLGSTSSWINLNPGALHGTFSWSAFAIAPDGTLFAAGSDFGQKHMARSHNDTTWAIHATGHGGAPGTNLSFGGDSVKYAVYYSNLCNDSFGAPGRWDRFGMMGSQTHPNDGPVWGDPANFEVVYMTTDLGIGASHNRGRNIYGVNKGIRAVQVNDFDMTLSKNTAWVASKSGIRKVSTYRKRPMWSDPFFPTGDGSPYLTVAMAGQDTNTVYACNLRVYKTTDGGAHWQRVFSAENPPYNYPSAGTPTTGAARIGAIAVCPFDTSIVMAGYVIDRNDNGGLFFSLDGGLTWEQQLIHVGAVGFDVNVEDIVFALEGTDTIAYVGIGYNATNPTGESVYRLKKNGKLWTVTQDMGRSGTSTGTAFRASIVDIAKSPTGDTLVACGTDIGTSLPVAYYKDVNASNLWQPFPMAGFPTMPNRQVRATTYGIDTVYVAVDESIYFLPVGTGSWSMGYTYPSGTRIQFLYYDELLVGTETGLYGHTGQTATHIEAQPQVLSAGLKLVPNPAPGLPVQVQLDQATQQETLIEVFNAAGQLVSGEWFPAGDTFELQGNTFLGKGIYLLRLSAGAARLQGRLVIE